MDQSYAISEYDIEDLSNVIIMIIIAGIKIILLLHILDKVDQGNIHFIYNYYKYCKLLIFKLLDTF